MRTLYSIRTSLTEEPKRLQDIPAGYERGLGCMTFYGGKVWLWAGRQNWRRKYDGADQQCFGRAVNGQFVFGQEPDVEAPTTKYRLNSLIAFDTAAGASGAWEDSPEFVDTGSCLAERRVEAPACTRIGSKWYLHSGDVDREDGGCTAYIATGLIDGQNPTLDVIAVNITTSMGAPGIPVPRGGDWEKSLYNGLSAEGLTLRWAPPLYSLGSIKKYILKGDAALLDDNLTLTATRRRWVDFANNVGVAQERVVVISSSCEDMYGLDEDAVPESTDESRRRRLLQDQVDAQVTGIVGVALGVDTDGLMPMDIATAIATIDDLGFAGVQLGPLSLDPTNSAITQIPPGYESADDDNWLDAVKNVTNKAAATFGYPAPGLRSSAPAPARRSCLQLIASIALAVCIAYGRGLF
eukprot:tig00021281_g19906.t1